MIGVLAGLGKGKWSLRQLVETINIALGKKDGKLSRNKFAYKERKLDRQDGDDGSNGGGSNGGGSGGSSDEDPGGAELP